MVRTHLKSALSYLDLLVRNGDRCAPLEALLWNWWAEDNGVVLPASWLMQRRVPASHSAVAKADHASVGALRQVLGGNGMVVWETLLDPRTLREELFRQSDLDTFDLEKSLRKLMKLVILTEDELRHLRQAERHMPIGKTEAADHFQRFTENGILLQNLSHVVGLACPLYCPPTRHRQAMELRSTASAFPYTCIESAE